MACIMRNMKQKELRLVEFDTKDLTTKEKWGLVALAFACVILGGGVVAIIFELVRLAIHGI